jgi:predicted PurR-regulated permease PerM
MEEPNANAPRREGRSVAIRSLPLVVLMAIALLFVLRVARGLLIPITIAFILQALFTPLVQFFARRRVPQGVSAAMIVGAMLCLLGTTAYYLRTPAQEWLEELPSRLYELERKLRGWKGSVADVRRATEQVEQLTTLEEDGGQLAVKLPEATSLLSTLVEQASTFVTSAAIALTLLFLLLAHEGAFLRNMVRILPRFEGKKLATRIVRGFQDQISEYLRTITLISLFLGLVVGLAMWAIGMPSPVLWGVMATLLNYVPYVGTAVGFLIVAFVALLTFDSPARAVVAPLTFLALTALEGGLITPAIIGRQLLLSPAVVLVWLVLWGWLWGIAGILLAVPLLMAVKILCEQIPALKPVGVLLSRGNSPPRGIRRQGAVRKRKLEQGRMQNPRATAGAPPRVGS